MTDTHTPAPVHYWHAPKVPPTAPRGASVVVRTACGRERVTVSVATLSEWAGNGATPDAATACPACVAATA